jgi:hypothetical protein
MHLSRYMGASLTMIDRRYAHLDRDGREHAIKLLDSSTGADEPSVPALDAAGRRSRRLSPPRRTEEP